MTHESTTAMQPTPLSFHLMHGISRALSTLSRNTRFLKSLELKSLFLRSLLLSTLLFGTSVFHPTAYADEGMHPISGIQKLNLQAKGLKIDPATIFSTEKTSLVDGVCRVNGCTGSFISPKGLIFTNHHCAYRAIQAASTADNDRLKNGFSAATFADEIPAPGYTVRVTESLRDVSAEVLSVVEPGMTYSERTKAIDKKKKLIEKSAEEANPEFRAEVAEMFTGKQYVLFLYTYIKDVRLVFAPPASVGVFGGDIDNWEWPRHTGDFSYMRAYVAPDGSSATYSEENVPYQPKKFIQVAPQGVSEGDFVFLLGYPGRTARHKTSAFLKYEEQVRLPFVVDLYNWQINTMLEDGKNDRTVALKHTSRIKRLANVEKRSRGQLKGLTRAKITARRAQKEVLLQAFINASEDRKTKYGEVLQEISNVYAEMTETADYELNLENLVSACRALYFAFTVYDAAVERQKTDLERESKYMDRNIGLTIRRLMLDHKDFHPATDRKMLAGMLARLSEVEQATKVNAIRAAAKATEKSIAEMFANSRITDANFVKECFEKTPTELKAVPDPFLQLVVKLYPHYLELREKKKSREGRLGELYGNLIDVKQRFLKTNFVPDANATLRLTYGQIRGYSPEDAVYKYPITTLKGVIDKTTGEDPFITPQKIIDLHAAKDFGKFKHPKLNDIPVGILYDTDTTGGNSGSPILNAHGQLVGVNFDRAFEATINDFAWNQSYSRSIGVDIRYALWITGKVYGANRLLKEMGVE